MYVQNGMNKRKMRKFPLLTGPGAGAHEMKKEDLLNDSEHAARSNPCKERRTAVSKRAKKWLFAWFTTCNSEICRRSASLALERVEVES